MDFLNLIIDRVDNVNIFNLIHARNPSQYTHLKTQVDEDLFEEFIAEVAEVSTFANRISEKRPDSYLVLQNLRNAGETFFQQFFPAGLAGRIRNSPGGYLYIHADDQAGRIPFELMHDGKGFLADRFFIGRSICSSLADKNKKEKDRLKFLIVADPTEDLPYAREEGEALFEYLNAEVSSADIEVELLSGSSITKMQLLEKMQQREVVHYAGHMHYDPKEGRSGWVLAGGKVLRAGEISSLNRVPSLVFSNSCLAWPLDARVSELKESSHLAAAFLQAGIENYIGTSWEIKDSKHTYEFAKVFYTSLFEEKSAGEALFDARKMARHHYPVNDLTWAGYVLHGSPNNRVFRGSGRRTFDASRSELTMKRVLDLYPCPVAKSYAAFLESQHSGNAEVQFSNLGVLLKNILIVAGSVLFGNYKYLKMSGDIPQKPVQDLNTWFVYIMDCLAGFKSISVEPAVTNFMEAFFLHRDTIRKMISWSGEMSNGLLPEDQLDSYLVTYQYNIENLLGDLSAFRSFYLVSVESPAKASMFFEGRQVRHRRLVAPETIDTGFSRQVEACEGKVCFFSPGKSILFPVEPFIEYDPDAGRLIFPMLSEKGALSASGS